MIKFITSEKFILPVIYIIAGVIIYNIIKALVGRISKNKHVDKKKKTIISLVKNIIKYLIMIFVVLGILSTYGVNTSGIITSIGVAGVIIGLALQDIVADFLAGVLILFDNQYAIGDVVTIDNFTGEVIAFGLMTTKIKAATGEVLIFNIDTLEKVLNNMKEEVEKIDGYIGNYKLLGIQEFASSSIKYMVTLECNNSKRFQVKRDFNMILKRNLDKAKIEIPYTKVDVYVKEK